MVPLLVVLAAASALAEAPVQAASEPPPQGPATITLTDPGAEPRRVLRFAPTPGATARYEVATTQSLSMAMRNPAGRTLDLSGLGEISPTIVMSMAHQVGEPEAGRVPVAVATLGARIEGAPDELRDSLQAGLAGSEGLGYQLWIGADGEIAAVEVASGAPGTADRVQDLVDQFLTRTPAFPAEPVGVGATWTVVVDMRLSGMDLVTTQTVTVTGMTATTVDTRTAFTMARGDAPLALPGLPADVAVEITRFDGTGMGMMSTDLSTMASTGTTTAVLELGLAMAGKAAPGVGMEMTVSQTTELRVPPEP